MIEKLDWNYLIDPDGTCYGKKVATNREMMEKINEIIELLNKEEDKEVKEPKFVVTVCCQGQPFYYYYNTLDEALTGYKNIYKEQKKYGTMRFSLDELYDVDHAYKAWKEGAKIG